MKVEIWSDVVCPWCYIGKRRFEKALAAFPHRDGVEVEWKAFELDPTSTSATLADEPGDGDHAGRIARKWAPIGRRLRHDRQSSPKRPLRRS